MSGGEIFRGVLMPWIWVRPDLSHLANYIRGLDQGDKIRKETKHLKTKQIKSNQKILLDSAKKSPISSIWYHRSFQIEEKKCNLEGVDIFCCGFKKRMKINSSVLWEHLLDLDSAICETFAGSTSTAAGLFAPKFFQSQTQSFSHKKALGKKAKL